MAAGNWFVRRGDKESGPFQESVIRQLAASGKLLPTDSLRAGVGGSWVQANRIQGLFTTQSATNLGPPPLPPGSGSAPPSKKICGWSIASLILGILSVFLSCLTAIPGIVCGIVALREISKSEQRGEARLTGRGLARAGIVTSVIFLILTVLGVLIGLLLPAVQAAREAARRSSCSNNLKQVLLGLHSSADANARDRDNFFPTDIVNPEGMPLLSWRVAILPYIEEQELYRRFRLSEPWDSPHNIQLLSEMPACFRCPSHHDAHSAGLTSYIAAKGAGMFLDPLERPRGFRDFSDGTSKTIAILEAPPSMAIEWTRPDPPLGDETTFLDAATECHAGGLVGVGFADGHVEFLPAVDFDRNVFRSLLTISGGESIPDY